MQHIMCLKVKGYLAWLLRKLGVVMRNLLCSYDIIQELPQYVSNYYHNDS